MVYGKPSTDDVRIDHLRPLLPPAILMEEIPVTPEHEDFVTTSRRAIAGTLRGEDGRLVVVVGPCSIHDPNAAIEYAHRLRDKASELGDALLLVMRTYFEKPRTTVGWKGLINDPHLDDTFAINEGLRITRGFLRQVASLGLPAGAEFLDPITPQFIADLVSWAAIGARTTESQVHRELASGLSMPVGFKNGTGGTTRIAVDAIRSAGHPHHFLSVTKQGLAAIVQTKGNPDCHVILRGGSQGPNYDEESVHRVLEQLRDNQCAPFVMVDCSHANSNKDHRRQPQVAEVLAQRIEGGDSSVTGVMMESFLVEGRQNPEAGKALTYGQSITDACMSWEQTVPVLERLAEATIKRRR